MLDEFKKVKNIKVSEHTVANLKRFRHDEDMSYDDTIYRLMKHYQNCKYRRTHGID